MQINNNNLRIFLIIIFSSTILLKFIYIFLSDYFNSAIFAGGDAYGMFLESITYGKNIKSTSFINPLSYYYMTLGKFYLFTFQNYIWASTISMIAWFISFIYLYKSMKLLKFSSQNILIAAVIFSFTPSIFVITSTTLREVWQLLFVNIFVYLLIKIYLNQSKIFFPILFVSISSIILFILHKALILFGLYSLLLIFFIVYTKLKIKTVFHPFLIIIILIPFFIFFYLFYNFYTVTGWSQLKKGIPLAIEQYQIGVINSSYSRSTYISNVSIKNYIDLFIFIPISFLKYLFEPIFSLNKISSLKDIIALSENLIRFILILLFFIKIRIKNLIFLYIFSMYLFLELIWSFGTVNWGTALRHHIPSIGLLIICALHKKQIIN